MLLLTFIHTNVSTYQRTYILKYEDMKVSKYIYTSVFGYKFKNYNSYHQTFRYKFYIYICILLFTYLYTYVCRYLNRYIHK